MEKTNGHYFFASPSHSVIWEGGRSYTPPLSLRKVRRKPFCNVFPDVWPLRWPFGVGTTELLRTCVLRYCLSAFTDSMLCKLTRKEKSNRRLDLAWGDRFPLVMVSKSWCFASNSFEDIIDEGIHDAHRSAGNTNIWMNLLQNSIDETSITLLSCSLSLHHFRPSFATLATFLGAFLCRALLRALHRRRLSTGTHLKRLIITIVTCSLRVLATETDASKDCTPIYVLGLDRKLQIRKRIETSNTFDFRTLWNPLSS